MQSQKNSLVEAIVGTFSEFIINFAVQLIVFPLFGVPATIAQMCYLSLVFLGVNMARNYIVRRAFNWLRKGVQTRFASLVESVANTIFGIVLGFSVQLVAFRLFGLNVSIVEVGGITAVFTVIGIARAYLVRRIFVTSAHG